MGKTSIMLSAITRMFEYRWIRRVLIVAPLRVCYRVWPDEIKKWSNFNHLTYSILHGSAETRKMRLNIPAHIHIVNRDGLRWLGDLIRRRNSKMLPWDLLVIDESSQYKNWSATCSKEARELALRIPYRVIMTGTPAPNNLIDIYPQTWLLDHGAALGENVTQFRSRYCHGLGERKHGRFELNSDAQQTIYDKISPMCLRLDAADHLSMPAKIEQDIVVDLPQQARDIYSYLEQELIVMMQQTVVKEVGRAAALYNACRQVAAGGVYDANKNQHVIHHEFDHAVRDLADELQGKPLLIAYQFNHDAERLKKVLPGLHVIHGGMSQKEFNRLVDKWNDGTLKPPYLAVQPQALSYGLNMQSGPGRHIVWYGPTDNLDLYIQLNARLWRQGVGSAVTIYRLRAADTIHDLIWDRTDKKQDTQTNLLEHLRAYCAMRSVVG